MRSSLAIAAVFAIGASAVGVGALDHVPAMYGSESSSALALSVLNQCSALHTLGDPIKYYGAGTTTGENALEIVGSGATQMIAPMSRPLGRGICGVASSSRAGAEGMVIALDAVAVAVNNGTVGAEGIDYPGSAGDPQNQWREVLRQIYTGMPSSAGANIFARDCNSATRKAIVNNWDNVFHGTVTACTDSHPSVPGTGVNGYDQNNTIIEPGIRHAFRRDDAAGTTNVFLQQLNLPPIDFAQAAPSGSTTLQAAAYRGLANSPFCNVKRPDDDWQPITLPANAVFGSNASQIPEMSNVGMPANSSLGTGLGYTTQEAGWASAKALSPYLNDYTDQDPIRRKCVGRGNNANANLPMEQVCAADGALGVVLPISVPQVAASAAYPTLPCDPSLGFTFGPAPTRANGDPVRCPNGDASQSFQCLLPVRADATQPDGVAFDCINPPLNVPLAIFDSDGDGSQFPDAPNTDGRSDVDGRVYNLSVRAADGSIRTEVRPDPTKVGVFSTPLVGAFYRIHSTRSLMTPPLQATNTCVAAASDDQLGCLTKASPCSVAYAGRAAISNNPGTSSALVNGIAQNKSTIQALLLGGNAYPFAHKLYLNTIQGFPLLHNSDSSVSGTDAEEELAKCFATLPFDGTINVESAALGLIKLPVPNGASTEQPLCEDFDGAAICGDATNTDACLGNGAVAGGSIPTSSCLNIDDGNPCTLDTCNTGTGIVSHANVAINTSCADADPCNGTEACDGGGHCLPGSALALDDGNACTSDACTASGGVTHTPVVPGTPCAAIDACHQPGSCNGSGTCGVGVATNTDDGNSCTADACDPSAGTVSHSPLMDGAACSPVNQCFSGSCASGTCKQTSAIAVADGDACTLDTCTATQGIEHRDCSTLNRTVSTVLADAATFLFAGSNPIQSGVPANAIAPSLIGVVIGHVYDRSGAPLLGASVTVANHPELGSTVTQADGAFDIAVNGGAAQRLRFTSPGYLPAERTIQTPVQDYVSLNDVTLVKPDANTTAIDLSGSQASLQVARGSTSTDSLGSRTATLFVPTGTQAAMSLSNGSTAPLAAMQFRATEYTVGGSNGLPGTLPSATTLAYAVELSADEAQAVGATEVDFSQPLPLYVENFLGLSVGARVPHGFYSASAGAWVPASNGLVVKILSVSGGEANLDVSGSGSAATGAALAALNITDQERIHLVGLYPVGQTLWRVPISHFSAQGAGFGSGPTQPTVDCTAPVCRDGNNNIIACTVALYTKTSTLQCRDQSGCPYDGGPACGCVPPFGPSDCHWTCCPLGYGEDNGVCRAQNGPPVTKCEDPPPPPTPSGDGPSGCEQPNASTIRCQRQSLGEDLAIAGTPYTLHYESDRQRGRQAAAQIPVTSATPPQGLLGVDLQVNVAGRSFLSTYTTQPSQAFSFVWDGKDAYGRLLQGAQPFAIHSSNRFAGVLKDSQTFGIVGDGSTLGNAPSSQPYVISKTWLGFIGGWDSQPLGLGGWSLDAHHVYDVSGRVLRLGNGDNQTLTDIPPVIQTVAGTGAAGLASGDGGAASSAVLGTPTAVAIGGDGSIYISSGQSCIRRKRCVKPIC